MACLLLAFGAAAQTVEGSALDPTQKVEGVSQAGYVALWWQWVLRLPDGVRAYQDPSGAQCGLNQAGPVWFLAGTEGTMRASRQCEIPSGRFIFFPVIAMITNATPGKTIDCKTAQARAGDNNNHLGKVSVTLDGQAIQRISARRIRSTGCFDAYANAAYLEHHRDYLPAATDGYWVMLAPLAEGRHHLVVHARYNNPGKPLGDLEQTFDYELQVVPDTPVPVSRPAVPTRPVPLPQGVITT